MAFDDEDQDESQPPEDQDEPSDDEGVTPTDDGGSIVKVAEDDAEPTADESDFYANLAEKLPSSELKILCDELIERISHDKNARKERDKQYSEGIKRTGLGDEAPGGAAFVGASEAVHPMLSKATVYYQSHTIGELMPPSGVVKDFIPGEATEARVAKARRKVAHMNWQFRVQMPEFRSQLERLLSQQPLGGSQYMRMIYDARRKKPTPMFYPLDRVFLPDSAGDYYSAERRTFVDTISQAEFESRIRNRFYRKVSLSSPAMAPDKTDAQRATDKVQGLDADPMNDEGMREIYTIETLADIESADRMRIPGGKPSETNQSGDDIDDTAEPLPYIIELDVHAREILSIVRNWEEDDDQHREMGWGIDFEFIPWRGAQSVGLIHLIGSLAGAATGALRALLDSALVNNTQTALMLKGSNTPGQTLELQIGQITTLEGGVMGGDIREMVMPLPFNPPSTMLYQLLGFLTEQGEDVVRTTFENLSDDGASNQPVGTTLALIEQGMKVLAAIHMRLHHAMDRVIEVLARINRLYITDEDIVDETGELLAKRSDYEGPRDVIPVSDPQVFSDIQRFAQLQVVSQRAQLMPQLYDLRKVELLILQRTKLPDAEDLLLPAPTTTEMNAVNENVALAFGRPVQAFPEQDHLAHIQVLLDFMQSPLLGSNPLIAQRYMTPALQHLAEHLVYWYLNHMVATVTDHAGADVGDMTKFKDKATKLEMDKTLATASPGVVNQAVQTFAKLPPVIQAAQQLLKSMQPQPMGVDPTATAVAQIGAQTAEKKIQTDSQDKAADRQADAAKEQAQAQAEIKQTIMQESGDTEREQAEIAAKEKINTDDNVTALEIAAGKIAEGHSTNLSTGTGIGKDGSPGMS
jgi:hypothetical protein